VDGKSSDEGRKKGSKKEISLSRPVSFDIIFDLLAAVV